MQGSKTYTKDSPMIPAREASVLVLECFLLMENDGGDDRVIKIEKATKLSMSFATCPANFRN